MHHILRQRGEGCQSRFSDKIQDDAIVTGGRSIACLQMRSVLGGDTLKGRETIGAIIEITDLKISLRRCRKLFPMFRMT